MDKILVTINYYVREKFWCSIRNLCDEELRKGQDPVLVFWKAFGIFKEGNVTEALRELTRVQERREITLAACIALIYYHERCRNVDQEAIDTLTLEMDNREEMASDRDLSTATTFLWHCQQFKRAGQLCQKIIDNTGGNPNSVCLKGWIYLSTPKEELQMKSVSFFDQAIAEDQPGQPKHLESMLGKAKVFEKSKQYDRALETLSEVAIQNKDFFPALLEKTKIHMVNGDWEQALETVQKVLVKDRQNVEGLRIYSFYLLTREHDLEYVCEKLDELISAMKFNEGRNADLFYNMSRLFARYCGRREPVLEKTLKMLDEAILLAPENADYHSEIAYQKCMLNDYNAAYQIYQKAITFDETNQTPLYGMIYCKIKQDQLEDAGQQLDFLIEISENHEKTSDHAYLEAIICWRHKQNKEQAIKLLDQALNLHIT
jgi:tetratricopeptide repeat protein 21B